MDDLILNEYLDYIQDSAVTKPAGFFIALGLIYALFKKWQKRKEIENGYCKKFKGDSLQLDLCVYKIQIKNGDTISNQLKQHGHTCSQSRRPERCREKVRYYIDKYERRMLDLEKKIQKVKFKIVKKQYKEKIRKIKQQQFGKMGELR